MLPSLKSNRTVVRSRAPLRLGFSGGGTDLSPFCDLHGGQVLNVTISLYAHTTIALRGDDRVCFVAADRKQSYEAEATTDIQAQDSSLVLHAGVYRRIMRQFNNGEALPVTITTYSDVMPGSGLGSSSTMVVSIIRLLQNYCRSLSASTISLISLTKLNALT
jgi:D-glycero-alpha-D-manno-heptose-7-phosphate kinase